MLEALQKIVREAGAARMEFALIASLIVVFLVTAAETVGTRATSPRATSLFADIRTAFHQGQAPG